MTAPRDIEPRIDWFLNHNPSGRGMCAQHTWHSLGGDYGNPPAWGTSDANACVDKVKASGRYWTPSSWDGPPPRGAWVGYKYGSNGHACLSLGDGRIATTDPSSGAMVGIEDLNYPNKWGASGWDVWTDQYNSVRFNVGKPIDHGDVFLSKLVYGQEDSDSVRRLQMHLNGHPLSGGETLPVTGNYFAETDEEVRLCQTQHGYGGDAPGASSVGPKQATHLFTGCGCNVVNDIEPEPAPEPEPPKPEPPEPENPETVKLPLGIEYHYSGKPSAPFSFGGSFKRIDVASWKPSKKGYTLGMLYANVDGSGEFRSRLVREPHGGSEADPTAYQTHYPKSGDNYLLTHVWFEAAEAGRPVHYELGTMDGETMNVGTRYAKFLFIPEDVLIAVAELGSAYTAVRRPFLGFLRWLRSAEPR